mmetsp:Transcript_16570/g.31409  ORF Transcript_16570/g.31409 Transcript_16570/m.31409 type:complete len:93 (+) Transcript_16570:548-826(+)
MAEDQKDPDDGDGAFRSRVFRWIRPWHLRTVMLTSSGKQHHHPMLAGGWALLLVRSFARSLDPSKNLSICSLYHAERTPATAEHTGQCNDEA